MGASIKRRSRRGMIEINMTPLVDVMLVLLVVFMVAAPLLATGVPLKLPQSKAAATPIETKPLVLSITVEGKKYLGETELGADLANALKSEPRIAQGEPLYVRADREVPYGIVARAIADVREAGVTAVTLLVEAEGR
jgi:biopolymer transport protein TolR